MDAVLKPVERRVLGVLLEKALAQPQYYPMSLNAIVAACNQKSNRDPLLELDEDAVFNALEVLRAAALVTRLLPGGASRVERYKHEVKERLHWEKPQRAVMAELLLRGPQTAGELRTHCARMCPFENPGAVSATLDSLAESDPPFVAMLPREPGQAAVRWAHRLYPPDERAALGLSDRRAAAGSSTPAAATNGAGHASAAQTSAGAHTSAAAPTSAALRTSTVATQSPAAATQSSTTATQSSTTVRNPATTGPASATTGPTSATSGPAPATTGFSPALAAGAPTGAFGDLPAELAALRAQVAALTRRVEVLEQRAERPGDPA